MSSYRSYVPWNKSGLSSSYSGSSSSSSRTYGTGKVSDIGVSSFTSQYDGGGSGGGGCGRRLGTGGDTSSTGRNNYLSGSNYRSPYLGHNYSRSSNGSYLNSSKESVTRSATTSSSSGATERRDNKENERLSLRDRYSSGTYPGRSRESSYSSKDKDDADTGTSHRTLARSISTKSNRDASPETTLKSTDVGVKADRMGIGSSMSPYRLYSRTYSRSTSRDSVTDVPSSTSTTAATTGHTTSSLRYGCSSRYGSNIIRSPVSEKPPTVFGLSRLGYSGRSSSRSNSQQDVEEPKKNEGKPVSAAAAPSSPVGANSQEAKKLDNKSENEIADEEEVTLTTFITIVTRGTSPTPPSTASYVRSRRTDLARVIEKTIEKRKSRPEMLDKETQSDPAENTARLSRYGVSSRWSAYLDRYPSAASSYSPVSRYTSRYGYSSSRGEDKETSVKSSADHEISDGTSTSEAPKTISSTVNLNNDVEKGTTYLGLKYNSSPSVSSERKMDNNTNNIKQSESVKIVEKPIETHVKGKKSVGGNEMKSNVSITGSDDSKQSTCAKTKTTNEEKEGKPADFLKKNKEMPQEKEVEGLTRGQIVKNISAKYSAQNTGTMPKSSRTVSTVGLSDITPSEGTQSKDSSDSKIEEVVSTKVPCVTSSSKTFPGATDIPQGNRVVPGIKSRNASPLTPSLEDVSDKMSSCEENKGTSDAAAASTTVTKTTPSTNKSVRSSTKVSSAVSLGIKSKSSSTTSLSSDDGPVKTSSVETSISNNASEWGNEGLNLVRTKSLKNVPAKHSEPAGIENVDFPYSEVSTNRTSLHEGIRGGTPQEDGSRTNGYCKQSSISGSLSNEGALIKAPVLPTLCSKALPDTPTNKLPPPVPKSDSSAQGLKLSSSLHSLNKFSVANKDFRKSSLNVDLPDNIQAEAFKKMQEKHRHASTCERKFSRSNSAGSGDSETSCADAGSTHSLPIEGNSNSTSLGTSKSLSKLYFSSSTSKLPSGTTDISIVVPERHGLDRTKATTNLVKSSCEPLRDTSCGNKLDTSDSDTDASSIETTSSSDSSSSDEEGEGLIQKIHISTNIQHRNRISPTGRDSQQMSVTAAVQDSICDELSVSADKPPRPPVSPKPSKTEESKSFFMRAFAPVTNLFKGKQESNKSGELQRTGTTQSLNKSDKEGLEVKMLGALDERISQDGVLDRKQETGSDMNDANDSVKYSLKYKIRKQESGERAWWMESNPNIPEGIKRIESSTSINERGDRETDSNTVIGVQKVSSNDSVNILQEQNSNSRDSGKKIKHKICKGTYQQSEEVPAGEVLGQINRIRSNSSINKIEGNEKAEVNTDGSEGGQKLSVSMSSQKNKHSENDTARKSERSEKNIGKLYKLRHQQSGELPWWLDSSAPIPEGVKRIQSNTSINKLPGSDTEERSFDSNNTEKTVGLQKIPSNISLNKCSNSLHNTGTPTVEEETSKAKIYRLRHQQSGELPWWLDSSAPVPEGVIRMQSSSSINKLQDSEGEKNTEGVQRTTSNASIKKPQESDEENKTAQTVQRIRSNSSVNKLQSSDSDSKRSGEGEKVKKKTYKIRHQESGELPWWLSKSASQSDGIQRVDSGQAVNKMQATEQKEDEASNRIFPYKLRRQESGEKAWWLSSRGDVPEGIIRFDSNQSLKEDLKPGEGKQGREDGSPTDTSEEEFNENMQEKEKVSGNLLPKFPLVLPATSLPGKTLHPKQESGRRSPYDNLQEPEQKTVKHQATKPRPKNVPLFIGNHTNIDDILGTAATLVNPVMGLSRLRKKLQGRGAGSSNEEDSGAESSDCEEIDPGQVRIHDSTAKIPHIQHIGNVTDEKGGRPSSGMIKLDDTALQLYKDGDYGSYLDLEASINEQQEEFDGFQTNRKNSIVLRTQLSVRVHTIIEKLLNSEGRELRRALFSLKQIFQEDKDLVHEFVQNDGLACLIKVGSEADQNYQNYILRALGQVMLYVDGMNGVMEHNETVQWLYALIASKFRLVVKTALKLLLVFIEYVETNCLLLIKAVHSVDTAQGLLAWNNIVKLLKDYDAADTELLIYAMTLVNKTLNGIPDQDTYYDQVDALEERGIEGTIQRYMSKQGTDLDLLRQFQIYEAVLHHEDGEEKGTPLKQLDETVRKTLRNRKSLSESMTTERRKSRRHSTGTSPMSSSLGGSGRVNTSSLQTSTLADDDESESSSSRSSPVPEINGSYKESKAGDAGVTPALRRRRERAERQRSFIREQQETAATLKATLGSPDERVADENQRLCKRLGNGTLDNGDSHSSNKLQQVNRTPSRKDLTPLMNAVNKLQDATSGAETPEGNGILKKPWVLSMMYGKNSAEEGSEDTPLVGENEQDDSAATSERKKLLQLKRENTVKDLTQKLSSQNIIHSPSEDGNNKNLNRIGDMTGLISKAKEGLAKSKSKQDVVKSPTSESIPKLVETKKSETELHWEELVHSMKRPLSLCDLDFTDLRSDDEVDILSPANISNGVPPPPPPVPMVPGMPSPRGSTAPPPPPPATRFNTVAPPPMPPVTSPALFGVSLRSQRSTLSNTSSTDTTKTPPSSPVKKTKKTVKLFWKEVRDDPIILAKLQQTGMIWDELKPISVDTQKLEHLFESRAKDLITKKQQEMNKNKEIIVLDHKRSNAINIGMTKLPPPRSIKTAILKMDATIMNREGIEKLLTMLPTEEERSKIQEAQVANPDMPLGSAEQFLLTLASITELPARLKLWAFKLDFENSEKEIAEPLMDLKQGMETLKTNKTFRGILSTLLSIGIFLNGNEVKGFQIEYLAKVPEVKDTVHKHSLLHHLCHMVMEKFPDSSDLYSEIGAVTRASKVDFDELAANILKMEQECKASWDHLKVIAKHDGSTMKVKMSDFLADCAERIIVLSIVHRRVMNRFHKFLLWLGIPLHRVADTKPNEFCRIVSEFSLEYRTTRERVLQQLEKKANHRERNKTRGKMITEVGKFRTKEDRADAELRQLLGSDLSDADSIHGTLPWRRQRKDLGRTVLSPLAREEMVNGNLTDGDDEILESLVKTATKAPATRTTPRERKRTRHADRKSLKRSRTRENNPVEGGRESP